MLGGSKNIEALMPMLAGRTHVSNHCCALKLPFLTPKLEPATSQQQGWKDRDLLSVPRLEETPSKRLIPEIDWKLKLAPEAGHLYPPKEKDPTTPSHAKISAASYKTNSSGG